MTVGLDNAATGTGPASRLMTAGGNSIQYGIYKDSAHSQPLGQYSRDQIPRLAPARPASHPVHPRKNKSTLTVCLG
jgi:spore coat protein U-like protein